MDNERLLKRLQEKKSEYNVEDWQQSRLQNIKIAGRINKYNYVLLNNKDLKGVKGGLKDL